MRKNRWRLIASLAVSAALCVSCGGPGATSPPGIDQPTGPGAGSLLGTGWPSPLELAGATGRHASAAKQLLLPGGDFDPLLEPQHVATAGAALNFAPHWTKQNPDPGGLAFALYRFTVTGYQGAKELGLAWTGDAGDTASFVAVANFPVNRWTFLPVDDAGTARLTDEQFAAALSPGLRELLAIPVVTGTTSRVLQSIRVGPDPGAFELLGVTPTTVVEWDNPPFFPLFTGPEPAGFIWNFGGACAPASSTITGPTPEPTLRNSGTFNCSVTALDADGTPTTLDFVLSVVEASDAPAELTAVWPNAGESGAELTLHGMTAGGLADSTGWQWDFGGGALPNMSTDERPTITLGAPGAYAASVSCSNAQGTAQHDFTLYVTTAGGELPPCLFGASASPFNL